MSPQQLSKPPVIAKDSEITAQPRWQPTKQQLDTPEKLQMVLKQVLKQHYDLQDAHAETLKRLAAAEAKLNAPPPIFPPGNGPADTLIVGLPVQPVDSANLLNGATMKWNKATSTFVIS